MFSGIAPDCDPCKRSPQGHKPQRPWGGGSGMSSSQGALPTPSSEQPHVIMALSGTHPVSQALPGQVLSLPRERGLWQNPSSVLDAIAASEKRGFFHSAACLSSTQKRRTVLQGTAPTSAPSLPPHLAPVTPQTGQLFEICPFRGPCLKRQAQAWRCARFTPFPMSQPGP